MDIQVAGTGDLTILLADLDRKLRLLIPAPLAWAFEPYAVGEDGATSSEYALILLLIASVLVGALGSLETGIAHGVNLAIAGFNTAS